MNVEKMTLIELKKELEERKNELEYTQDRIKALENEIYRRGESKWGKVNWNLKC